MAELLILLVAGVAIAAGSYYLGWRAHRRSVLLDIENMMSQLIVNVKLEQINDNYLLYTEDDDQFICQADTLEKIAQQFSEKMGEDHVGVLSWQGEQLVIVGGKIESAAATF